MVNQERMFRVLVIAISLKNNQIANSKDEVAESLFSAPVSELIDGGYIEEVVDSKEESDDEAKKAEDDKANSAKTDASDKKDDSANLGDIANSIPGAKTNQVKK